MIVVTFLIYGILKKVNVFDAFCEGAVNGLKVAFSIAPTMIGIIAAVSLLRAGGVLDALEKGISPLAQKLGFPAEIVPVALLRPVSGSGSSALMMDVFENYGPDSFIGRIVSVMAGATDTTFYAVALYFGSVGVKKIRHTLLSGLLADFTAVVFSVITVRLFF